MSDHAGSLSASASDASEAERDLEAETEGVNPLLSAYRDKSSFRSSSLSFHDRYGGLMLSFLTMALLYCGTLGLQQ